MPFTKEESAKIGAILKSDMDERLLSEKDISEETGLTPQTVCHAVTGKVPVSVKAYAAINKCLSKHQKKKIIMRAKNG